MSAYRSELSDDAGVAGLDGSEVESFAAANPNVQYVDCVFVDLCGNVRGKRVNLGELKELFRSGIAIPHRIYFLDARGDPVEGLGPRASGTGTAWPVAGSLTPVSWAQRAHGQVLMALNDEKGEPYFGEPRNVLRRVMGRFAEFDAAPAVGSSLEAYIVERERGIGGVPQRIVAEAGLVGVLREEIATAAATQGLPAVTLEVREAQLRIGMALETDALAAADHAVLLRQIVRAVARKHKCDAVVMPKPFPEQAGNVLRVSVDVRRASGESVFGVLPDGGLVRFAVGGLQALLPESLALFAPSVNAFRRFAGAHASACNRRWGYANASANLSVLAEAGSSPHILHQVACSDANPYLVIAAILAGVHFGIGQNIDPGPPTDADAKRFADPTFPNNIDAALLALENGSVLREYLGPDYVDLYCATKRAELERLREVIPAHEYDWYA